MAHELFFSQRSNTWCVPSFDCEPVSKPLKRSNATELDKALSDRSFTQSNLKRRKHETSLSKLLQACEPQKPSELAISRQKQNEICDWLQCKTLMGQPSMLVLSGPSGCGKTAAIKLLARENGFDVIEWITPVDQAEDENSETRRIKFKLLREIYNLILNFQFFLERIMRQGDRFEDHLIRATRYRTVLGDCFKQLLLIKDIPNVYQENCQSFFALLE